MASEFYNKFKRSIGTIDWSDNDNTDIRVALFTSDYTPDIDAHTFFSDTSDEVADGDGYTAGGKLTANRAIVADDGNDWAEYDLDDTVWSDSTITARGAVIYKDTGDASTSPLIGYIDFGEDKSSSDGDFTIQWHDDGAFRVS